MALEDKDMKLYQKGDIKTDKILKDERQRWKNSSFIVSLEFAVTGILTAFKEEKNLRKHVIVSILVVIAGFIFQIDRIDWILLFLAVFLVITAELINSAIESAVDLAADYNFHMRAKRAKDTAAGAVLVISCFAVIIGLFVFGPKIINLIWR